MSPTINRRRFSQLALLHLPSLKAGAIFSADTQSSWLPEPQEAGYVPTPQGWPWYRIIGEEHIAKGKTPLVCLHGGPGASHYYFLALLDKRRSEACRPADKAACSLTMAIHLCPPA